MLDGHDAISDTANGNSEIFRAEDFETKFDTVREEIAVRQANVAFWKKYTSEGLIFLGVTCLAFAGLWPSFISKYPMAVIVMTSLTMLLALYIFGACLVIPLILRLLDKMRYYQKRYAWGYMLPIYIRNFCVCTVVYSSMLIPTANFVVSLNNYKLLTHAVSETNQRLWVASENDDISSDLRVTRKRVYEITMRHRLGFPIPDEFSSNKAYVNSNGNYHYSSHYRANVVSIFRHLFSLHYSPVSSWAYFTKEV